MTTSTHAPSLAPNAPASAMEQLVVAGAIHAARGNAPITADTVGAIVRCPAPLLRQLYRIEPLPDGRTRACD